MYHSLKVKRVELPKEVKPPKGWRFSGDPSFLNLSNSDFSAYFLIVNTRVRIASQTGIPLSREKNDEWEVEERYGQIEVKIVHGSKLSNREAKELAVKLAKNLNKERFVYTLTWVTVAALLAGLVSFFLSKL